jgi:plasmid stabilization system protein ParE
MAFDYKILWTDEAINNLESILDYLANRWTQREVDNFKVRLSKFISIIEQNPKPFPISQYNPRLRKAVLSNRQLFSTKFLDK